ncbi:MAG: alpha/beta fold hydrolase [Nocardioidaceae bacterium]
MTYATSGFPHRLRGLAAIAVSGLLVLAGCGGAQDVSGGKPTPSTGSDTASGGPTSPGPSTGTGGLPQGFGAGPAGTGLTRFYDQKVSWTSCDGGQCASIWVPLDYSDPNGQAITIKAKRQVATDPAKREGTLLINPGGPGGSGIDYLGYIGLAKSITAAYDVLGFDPRGVGQSTPVDCISNSQLDTFVAADPTPDSPAEIQQLQQLAKSFAAGCLARSGPLLAHVSTVEVARDMDIIRAVVSDPKLNFFGASYGTYMGATYAALFPKKVGRMVLDGAVDPLAAPRQSAVDQAAGFDDALTAYLAYCVGQGNCPLGTSVDAARNRLIELFKQLDASPLPTSSGRKLTEGLAFLGVIVPLYSRDSWTYLTQGLKQAVDGSGDTLLFLADFYADRQTDGSYANNSLEAQSAVNCLDHPESESLRQIEAGRQDFTARAPVFGPVAMWWPYTCSNWPVKPTEPQPDFSAKGAAPIVVIGTTRDPATPYEQAVKLADELQSGVLLSRDGDGHTAYGSGNVCIQRAVDTYLVDGTPPPDGTTC